MISCYSMCESMCMEVWSEGRFDEEWRRRGTRPLNIQILQLFRPDGNLAVRHNLVRTEALDL